MTDETLRKAIDLQQRIKRCGDIIDDLNEEYTDFYIISNPQQGSVKRVCDLPDELHKLLRQMYVGRIMELTEEFHNL